MLFGDVPQGSAIFVRGVRLAPGLNEKGQKAFEEEENGSLPL